MKEKSEFLFEFIKHRKKVASFMPTSKHTVDKICDHIDYNRYNIIVELGAGTGAVTKGLQRKLGENSRLILIETNKKFCRRLKKDFKDERITVYNESAANLKDILDDEEIDHVNYIVSGIPFSHLSQEDIKIILESSKSALNQGGKFIGYQVKKSIEDHLSKYFSHIESEKLKKSILRLYVAYN